MDQAIAKDKMDAAASFVVGIIIIVPKPPKIIPPPFERSLMTASPPPLIVIIVTAVGGVVVDGGVMDQAVAKDVMDVEASFAVGIIIITPTPPKIIAPPFEQLATKASPEPSSSPHCLLTNGSRIRVRGL